MTCPRQRNQLGYSLLKLTAICITYKRPLDLEFSIECFLRQDYPNKALIILDDAGQYPNMEGDGWQLISVPQRFATIGEKRNASAALAPQDTDVYCVWDDDDIYLPWHMSGIAKAAESGNFIIPSVCYIDIPTRFGLKDTGGLHHGSWGFSRELFTKVRGYPFVQSGQDLDFRAIALGEGEAVRADPIALGLKPSYVYRWGQSKRPHLSGYGRGQRGYEALGEKPFDKVQELKPHWDRDWIKDVRDLV